MRQTPKFLRGSIQELKSHLEDKNAPFGVDLLIPQVGGNARKTNVDYTDGQLPQLIDVIIEEGASLFVSAVGVPPRWAVDKLHAAGIVVMKWVYLCNNIHRVVHLDITSVQYDRSSEGNEIWPLTKFFAISFRDHQHVAKALAQGKISKSMSLKPDIEGVQALMLSAPKEVRVAAIRVTRKTNNVLYSRSTRLTSFFANRPFSILIPAVVDLCKNTKSPLTGEPVLVVAAGGIADGRGLAAALACVSPL